jgi:hypothetical protein
LLRSWSNTHLIKYLHTQKWPDLLDIILGMMLKADLVFLLNAQLTFRVTRNKSAFFVICIRYKNATYTTYAHLIRYLWILLLALFQYQCNLEICREKLHSILAFIFSTLGWRICITSTEVLLRKDFWSYSMCLRCRKMFSKDIWLLL